MQNFSAKKKTFSAKSKKQTIIGITAKSNLKRLGKVRISRIKTTA